MESYLPILKNTDIFYKLNLGQLKLISEICHEEIFNSGEVIFPEGSSSDELYIIADGVVDILINPDLVSDQIDRAHEPVIISRLRRGQSFGEIALVDQGLRSASARISQDNTRVLIIPSDKLMAICENHPHLGFRLMLNLAADLALKIRSTSLRVREEMLYGRAQK